MPTGRDNHGVTLKLLDSGALPGWAGKATNTEQNTHCLLYLVALHPPKIRSTRARRLRLKDSLGVGDAARDREESEVGREILAQLLENADIAREQRVPLCQDTGLVEGVDLGGGRHDPELVGMDAGEVTDAQSR